MARGRSSGGVGVVLHTPRVVRVVRGSRRCGGGSSGRRTRHYSDCGEAEPPERAGADGAVRGAGETQSQRGRRDEVGVDGKGLSRARHLVRRGRLWAAAADTPPRPLLFAPLPSSAGDPHGSFIPPLNRSVEVQYGLFGLVVGAVLDERRSLGAPRAVSLARCALRAPCRSGQTASRGRSHPPETRGWPRQFEDSPPPPR